MTGMTAAHSASPSVSVLLPLYDCGDELSAAFDRLARTDLQHCEIVMVDDGSTDGTARMAQDFADAMPGARLVRHERNRGVAATRNAALAHARGEYVWFVDWDDAWDPAIVQKMLAAAHAHDADVVICRAARASAIGARGPIIDGLRDDAVMSGRQAFELVLRGRIQGYLWSKLIRRNVLPPDPFPALRSQEDFGGIVPVLAAASRVVTVGEVLYVHLTRQGSLTNSVEAPLDGLAASRAIAHTTAKALGPDADLARLLTYFDYGLYYLALANTACRLGVTAEYVRSHLDEARAGMSWRGLGAVARVSPSTALRAAVVKVTGRHYVHVYRGYVRARQAVRQRLERPVPRGGR